MTLMQEIELAVQSAAQRVGPAVIGLGRRGGGSGTVFATGLVLTNAHNLRRDETVVTFSDGRRETGQVVGVDPDLDVAVVAADTAGVEPVEWLPEYSAARLGQSVLALANPGGRGLRVAPGFVCGVSRSFRGPRGRRIGGAIEHTAPLPRGSSGGPLVDEHGRLLGINTVRVEGGLILALPADRVLRARLDSLGRGEVPSRARLGVAIAPPPVARRLRRAVGLPERDGVLIRAVEAESPAHRAGLERGDLIVSAGTQELDRVDALYEALDGTRPGAELELTIVRGVDERTVKVELLAE
jgi:serine protease Do